MLDTYDLLRYTPREALAQIYNDAAGTDVNPRELGDIDIEDLGDGRTKATIHFIAPLDDFYPHRRTGTSVLYYNRYVLDELLQYGAYVPLHLPCTVHDVLARLQRNRKGLFDLNEFENAVITSSDPYRIEAKSTSLRWVGGFDVTVATVADTHININDSMDDPMLTIISKMTGRTSINSMVDTYILDFPNEDRNSTLP